VFVGACALDLASHQLFASDGSELPLTGMEFALLKVFLERPNQVLNQHVRGCALRWVAAVVRHLGPAVGIATLTHVGHRGTKILQLATRFGQLAALGALLVLLNVGQAAQRGRLHLALDTLGLEPVARPRI
jgi:hypothetical protein